MLFQPYSGWNFLGLLTDEGMQRSPTSLKPLTNILHSYTLPKEDTKKLNHVTEPLSSADISIFSRKSANFALSKNTDTDYILVHNFQFF